MEPKIDWQAALDGSRPVTTRDGRKVVLYCVDAPGSWPVHGLIEGSPVPTAWKGNGRWYGTFYDKGSVDLIQPPRRFKYERWVNVYNDPSFGNHYATKENADRHAGLARIACVKVVIEGEEGEGLE